MKRRSWLSLSGLSSFVAIAVHAAEQEAPSTPSWEVGAEGFRWIVYGGLFGRNLRRNLQWIFQAEFTADVSVGIYPGIYDG